MSIKGLVLAAGFGTRLRPVTSFFPKPMLPVANMPIVDFGLSRLSTIGIKDVAVNLHYMPEAVKNYLVGQQRFDQNIIFSEEPNILGTGGGVKAIREWVGANDLCVTNGDTVLLADLKEIVKVHQAGDALVTLALIPVSDPGRFSPVAVDSAGKVVDIGEHLGAYPDRIGVFVGFYILSSKLFDEMPDRDHFCMVNDVWLPLLKKKPGSILAQFVKGEFFDMGTPKDYLAANLTMLSNHLNPSSALAEGMRHLGDNIYIGRHIDLGRKVNFVGPCIIGDNVRIEGGSEIGPGVAVGKKAFLGPWTRLKRTVVLPGGLLPGGGIHTNSIIFDRESLSVELAD